MSIASLLSHFNVDTPRFVSDSGRVVFDAAKDKDGVFTNAEHGTVTPVAPHTFHGGVERPESDATELAAWWENSARLQRHVDAMQRAFPLFTFVAPEDDKAPYWAGDINTGRGSFKVAIVLRRDEGLPRVAVLNRRLGAPAGRYWQKPPHLYTNDNLCIAGEDDWDAAEHTAATAAVWAAHWLAAYTEWFFMGRLWPSEGVDAVAS